jgi:hypothetical protein
VKHYRPLTDKEKTLLDEMSRSTDPGKEALEQLAFELEQSELARQAFGAELVRLRQIVALARANKRALPPKLREAIDRMPHARTFEQLLAHAEAE